MARSKGVTLKGAAAGAFIEALSGKVPATVEDHYLRVATFVHMSMATGDVTSAKLILQHLVDHGIVKTALSLSR